MDIDSIMTQLNPLVVRLLQSRLHGLLSRGLMLVHVVGVKSGKPYTIPVGYQYQTLASGSEQCVVLVSKSRRKNWWRNYKTEVPVDITLGGELRSGLGALLDKQSQFFEETIIQTFQRMPVLATQFGINYSDKQGLTAEDLAIVGLDGGVLVIKL